MGKKDLLATAIFGAVSPLRLLSRMLNTSRLIVLAYHRIGDSPGVDNAFQDETISATPEMFRDQLAFLKRYFHVTTFADLAAQIDAGDSIPKNTAIITFDDGYRDNFDVALPILSEFKLPAVVYVVTDNIDSGKPFWFDSLSYTLMHAPDGALKLLDGRHVLEVTANNRKALRRQIGDIIRQLSDEQRLAVLDDLLSYSGCADKLASERRLVMTWDEIREMHASGIEIGSHTLSHPFLNRLSDRQLKSEIFTSKSTIESRIGAPVVSLSYPTGGKSYYDARAMEFAHAAGYKFAVSYDHAALPYSDHVRYEIPRIHVELDVSPALFRANSLMPQIFLRNRKLQVS